MSSIAEGEDILERKKAWAELEREQNEVKRNIKSLMRFEPGTRVIDDPSLAERVSSVRMVPQKYETAEDLATEKRMESQFHSNAGKAASPAQPSSKSRATTTPIQARASQESASSNGKKDTQKRQWIAPSGGDDEKSDNSPKPQTSGYGSRHMAEERKQTTATFGGKDSSEKKSSPTKPAQQREESPNLNRQASTDNKPKLFKGGGTNPFAKRQAAAANFGGSSAAASQEPKNDGLFYPGSQAQAQKPASGNNQFSSITSFGAGAGGNSKMVDRDRKSSSNIEEAYSEDGFDEESLGNSQLNVVS